jgi:hypothetical protein
VEESEVICSPAACNYLIFHPEYRSVCCRNFPTELHPAMPEHTTVPSAAVKLAYSGCTELYKAMKGIKDTPVHIRYLFVELESLYAVLGNLITVFHGVKLKTKQRGPPSSHCPGSG